MTMGGGQITQNVVPQQDNQGGPGMNVLQGVSGAPGMGPRIRMQVCLDDDLIILYLKKNI